MKFDLILRGELPGATNAALLREAVGHVFASFGGRLDVMNTPLRPARPGSLVDVVALPVDPHAALREWLDDQKDAARRRMDALDRQPLTDTVYREHRQAEAWIDRIDEIFTRLDKRATARATAVTSNAGDRVAARLGVAA